MENVGNVEQMEINDLTENITYSMQVATKEI